MKLVRLTAILAAPLFLASCLLSPGKFVSSLDIRKDRSFTFAYQGEVILLDPSGGATNGLGKALGGDGDGESGKPAARWEAPAPPADEATGNIAAADEPSAQLVA